MESLMSPEEKEEFFQARKLAETILNDGVERVSTSAMAKIYEEQQQRFWKKEEEHQQWLAEVEAKMEKREEEQKKQHQELLNILKQAGLKITIEACGCCDSPWIKVYDQSNNLLLETENIEIELEDYDG